MNDQSDAYREDSLEPKTPEHVDRPNAVPAQPYWPLSFLEWCFAGAIVLLLIVVVFVPQVSVRDRTRPLRAQRLKQIGLALDNYHDAYRCYPPAYIADKDGKPMHSWRVLILPHFVLGERDRKVLSAESLKQLYESYDFSKPWDYPANRDVLEQMPIVYRCPDDTDADPTCTSYAGAFCPDCMFRGAQPLRIRDFPDGRSNTIMVGEMMEATSPWTKPEDVVVEHEPRLNQPGGFGSPKFPGCSFVFVDGHLQWVSGKSPTETLLKLYRRNDGEVVEPTP
jgi:hypothetical protein